MQKEKEKKVKRPVGRPKKELDVKQIEMLSGFGCSVLEMAEFFTVDESLLRRRYMDKIRHGRQKLKLRIRQLQLKYASQGSVPLLIFLGKNLLNQSDKQQIDMTGNLEAVLKECGFEESQIGKKDSKPGKALEADGVRTDEESVRRAFKSGQVSN
tara:strand:- start:1194 stop:1658 length:465 start_codon:yes stop_codon:yes gene_type:complete